MISLETRKAYTEVNIILELLGEKYSDKIPSKIKNAFKTRADQQYNPSIDIHKPILEQSVKRKTITIISALNLQYWCNDDEKQKLKSAYYENGVKYKQKLNEKYNVDNLFCDRNRESIIENPKEKDIIIYKELPKYKRIFKKIKDFLLNIKNKKMKGGNIMDVEKAVVECVEKIKSLSEGVEFTIGEFYPEGFEDTFKAKMELFKKIVDKLNEEKINISACYPGAIGGMPYHALYRRVE